MALSDEQLSGLLTGLTQAIKDLGEGQKKIIEKLDASALKIDPTKLVATTKGVTPQLREVTPKDPSKPNVEEPVLKHPFNGTPVVKICNKCGQPFSGASLHCRG
jgi:hypothetical protein